MNVNYALYDSYHLFVTMVDAFGSGRVQVKPPQRGIFPLDHDKECRPSMTVYLNCLNENHADHVHCRNEAKQYLECRMNHNLMMEESLKNLGYDDKTNDMTSDDRVERNPAESKEAKGFIAGTGVKASHKWKLWSTNGPLPSQKPSNDTTKVKPGDKE